MAVELTRDADALICLLYEAYLSEREKGTPKSTAKLFGSGKAIHKEIVPKWSYEDTDETCRELDRAGLLNCSYADGIVWRAELSDHGIIYMERRFSNGLKSVLEYLAKIKSVVPFA